MNGHIAPIAPEDDRVAHKRPDGIDMTTAELEKQPDLSEHHATA
jgi:hypothetical protein